MEEKKNTNKPTPKAVDTTPKEPQALPKPKPPTPVANTTPPVVSLLPKNSPAEQTKATPPKSTIKGPPAASSPTIKPLPTSSNVTAPTAEKDTSPSETPQKPQVEPLPQSKAKQPSVFSATDPTSTSLEQTTAEPQKDVQVLAPDPARSAAPLITPPPTGLSRLAFWRRGQQRDEQLARITEGYVELVDLVRAIKSQADSQHRNNVILRESLSHLPEAIKSLEGFGNSHQKVGSALEKIHDQMKSYSAKDQRLAESMDDFNGTLKGMDDTSKATIQTFDRVQERMRDSDIRMENLFNNVRNTEEKVSDTMVRLQRNMSIMQTFFMICMLAAIGGLIYTLLNKTPPSAPQPQITQPTPPLDSQAGEATQPEIPQPVTSPVQELEKPVVDIIELSPSTSEIISSDNTPAIELPFIEETSDLLEKDPISSETTDTPIQVDTAPLNITE